MSRNTVRKHVPVETDASADRRQPTPSVRHAAEARAMTRLAHIRAMVAQADEALSRRLTYDHPFDLGSKIAAYRAFRQTVRDCVLGKSDDEAPGGAPR
jgi:hypothetical protein